MTTPDTFANGNPEDAPTTPLSFLFYLMEPEPRQEIIEHALNARPRVSAELRDGLNRAVNDNAPRIPGFRNAGLAPPSLILPQLCEATPLDADLAAAVAKVWFDGQRQLRDEMAALLEESEIPVPHRSSPPEAVLVGASTKSIYELLQRYRETHPDRDWTQVVFMCQLLTGISDVDIDPEEDELKVAELLDATFNALQELSATHPEWEEAIPNFSASLAGLIERKQEHRKLVGPLKELLDSIEEGHAGLLEFFQSDTSAWDLEDIGPDFPFRQAQERGETLRDLLAEYAPIHDRAPVIAEELERAGQRAELLPRIVDAGAKLQRLFDGEPLAGSDDDNGTDRTDRLESDDDAEPVCSPLPAASLAPDDTTGQPAPEREVPVPPCDIEGYLLLQLTLQDLEHENDDLEHENTDLRTQVKTLEQRLYESRNQEEGWRLALVHQDNPDGDDQGPEPEDVSAAVRLAGERFPSQLLFQLNADSNVEDCPFKWPAQVWNALSWLATDYFTSRLGRNPIGDMDESCRLACGMWYKTSQHETTMTQFRESYTTRVDGRLIWLGEHIGKGNSFDPRRTIRIAFDWDRQLQKVVIGYIGQHQRTAAS